MKKKPITPISAASRQRIPAANEDISSQLFGRRRFLQSAGGVAATCAFASVAGGALLGGCTANQDAPAYAYWRQKEKGDLNDLQYLVMCATLAPSPHNTQAWNFRITDADANFGESNGGSIDVYADRSRHLGSADSEYRMMLIAIGCAIENIGVAARRLGYRMEVEALDADRRFAQDGFCARLRLRRDFVQSHPWFDAIFARQTTRTAFAMTQPSAVLRQGLQAPQQDLPGIGLTWLPLGPATPRLHRMVTASTQLYLNQQRHDAGMHWFRITRDEWEHKRDGIAVFNGDASPVVKHYVEWMVDQEDLKGRDFIHAEVDAVARVVEATPLWGLVYADKVSANARVLGGRMAERVYLEATTRGYAVQPLCYPTELPEVARGLSQFAGLPVGAEPLFLFRVGKSDYVGKSVRRDLRDVLIA
jgi:hypothetical protein